MFSSHALPIPLYRIAHSAERRASIGQLVRIVQIVESVKVVEDVEVVEIVNSSIGQIVIEAIHNHLTIRQIDDLTCCLLPPEHPRLARLARLLVLPYLACWLQI